LTWCSCGYSRFNNCGVNKNEPLEYCMVDDLAHCWSGNDCCDDECLDQDPANMDFSAHILDFFSAIPRRAGMLNATALASKLEIQLTTTNVGFADKRV
jgi:hypothetical protein